MIDGPVPKVVISRVRPFRVATFINQNDPDWKQTCLRVIELYSQMWGGAYNLIIPTDGTTVHPLFLRILRQFDPDYLWQYIKTYKDIEMIRPDEFEKRVDAIVERDKSRFTMTEQELREDIKRRLLGHHVDNFSVTLPLAQKLLRVINPFRSPEQSKKAIPASIYSKSANSEISVSPISMILKTGKYEVIEDIQADSEDELFNLKLSSITGRVGI